MSSGSIFPSNPRFESTLILVESDEGEGLRVSSHFLLLDGFGLTFGFFSLLKSYTRKWLYNKIGWLGFISRYVTLKRLVFLFRT